MSRVQRGAPGWPARLDELEPLPPPRALYLQGVALDSDAVAVAVVGTRRPTGAGIQAARDIATGLAEAGWVVVSGLAVGIDATAHRAALDAGGRTVAVLGCGLDVAYPERNSELKARIAREGTLVTEYPPGTPPARHRFPDRNRIIAGLSLGVVVVEGAVTSGGLVTARLALDANRSVYAVPGSIRNPMAAGPNELIRAGRAALVTCAQDVFDDLAPGLVWDELPRRSGTSPSDPAERDVLALLDDAPVAPDRLLEGVDLTAGELALALSRLEVRGFAERGPGGYALTAAGARARSGAR